MILLFLIALAILGIILLIIYFLAWHDEYKEYLNDINSLDSSKVKIIYNLKSKMIKSIIKVSNKWKFDYMDYARYNYYVETTRHFQLAYLENTNKPIIIIKIPFLLYIKMAKAKNNQDNIDKIRIAKNKENENVRYLINRLQDDIDVLKQQANEEISSACDTVKEVTERLNKE